MNELSSLLSLTNKFFNAVPNEIESTPVREKEQKQKQNTPVKSRLPELFDPDDIRKVTNVSPMDHPNMSGAPFDKMRTSLWIKVSGVFSSKKKAV